MDKFVKLLTFLFLFISIIGSSGCATGVMGETVMGMPGSPAWHSSASIQTKIAHFKSTCSAYGITDGTPQMASCLQAEIQNSQNLAQSRMNAINAFNANNRSFTCYSYGNTTTCH